MNIFLRKLGVFLIILIAYFGINILINSLIIKKSTVPLKDANILIDGDSHLEKSLDPKQFYSAENISQTAEPYIVTYLKLKFLLPQIKVDTLIVGFSHHNLSAFNDFKFSDSFWSSEMFERIYPIYHSDEVQGVPVNKSDFYKAYFRNMTLFPRSNHFHFIGQYSNVDYSNVNDVEEAIERHFQYNGEDAGISKTAISYLDSIIQLTRRNNITPILVGCPVYKGYFNEIPQYVKERYKAEKKRLKSENVLVIDLTEEYYDDKYFLNSDHLNQQGAHKFTNEIIKILSKPGTLSFRAGQENIEEP